MVIVLFEGSCFDLPSANATGDGEIPGIKGLRFETVQFATLISVETESGGSDRKWLADYAEDKLKKAGLRPDATPRQGAMHERGSTLVLTLRAWRVAQCPGKLLYLKGLVLYEDAVRVREPKTWVRAPTHGFPDADIAVLDEQEASTERFARDIDFLLDDFIQHYKQWNSLPMKGRE